MRAAGVLVSQELSVCVFWGGGDITKTVCCLATGWDESVPPSYCVPRLSVRSPSLDAASFHLALYAVRAWRAGARGRPRARRGTRLPGSPTTAGAWVQGGGCVGSCGSTYRSYLDPRRWH